MAYIRTKNISGNRYAYLVETTNISKGPRQKVKQYLGRIYELEKKREVSEAGLDLKNREEIVNELVISELKARGFKEKRDNLRHKNMIFSSKNFTLTKKNKSKTKKEAIIALNEGYLCSFTLQRLINFKKSKDFNKDAYTLAKYFLEAGLNIPKELFVKFYQGLK